MGADQVTLFRIKSWILVFLSGATFRPCFGADVAPQVEMHAVITIKKNVTVELSRIYLRDIADCSGYSELCGEIYSVDLFESPMAGKASWISSEQVRKILEEEFPDTSILIEGAKRTKIYAASADFTSEDMKSFVQNYVSENQLLPPSMVVSHFQTAHPIQKRSGAEAYHISYIRGLNVHSESWLKRATSSMVRISGQLTNSANSNDYSVFQAMIRLKIKQKVPVLVRNVEAGVSLKPEFFEIRDVTLQGAPGTYIGELSKFDGAVTRRSLQAGMAISASDIRVVPLVLNQSTIEVVQENSGMEIKSTGRSLQSGKLGDRIQVELPASRKRVFAVVTGKNSVRIAR